MRRLGGVVQALHDSPPRIRRGLPGRLPGSIWQPALQERLFVKGEVVHREAKGVGHRGNPLLRVFRHYVDLHHLRVVVELEGCEVCPG